MLNHFECFSAINGAKKKPEKSVRVCFVRGRWCSCAEGQGLWGHLQGHVMASCHWSSLRLSFLCHRWPSSSLTAVRSLWGLASTWTSSTVTRGTAPARHTLSLLYHWTDHSCKNVLYAFHFINGFWRFLFLKVLYFSNKNITVLGRH